MGEAACEIVQPKKRAFLAAFAITGSITASAQKAECRRSTHYDWLTNDHDGSYLIAFEEARLEACDRLEVEARRRAVQGLEKGVWHNGKRVGTEKVFSDILLIFLLKANNPAKFRDRYEVKTTNVNLHHDLEAMRGAMQDMMQDPECAQLAEKLAERMAKTVDVKVLDRQPLGGKSKNGSSGNGQGK